MALGGVGPALALQQLRGGVSGEAIDYDRLARALARIKVQASIVDVKNGLGRDAKTQRLSNG